MLRWDLGPMQLWIPFGKVQVQYMQSVNRWSLVKQKHATVVAHNQLNNYFFNNIELRGIAQKHWSDTLEYVTRTTETNNWLLALSFYMRITQDNYMHMYHLFCSSVVYLIYSNVSKGNIIMLYIHITWRRRSVM